jgi:hypothetical protein
LEPPPEGRLRRAYLHLSHSTDSRRSPLPPHQDLRSSFMAHAPSFLGVVRFIEPDAKGGERSVWSRLWWPSVVARLTGQRG